MKIINILFLVSFCFLTTSMVPIPFSHFKGASGALWALQATLINPTGEAASWFGQSVSISGDGLYAIVGASQEDVTNTDQGQAYIFVRTGTSWALQATLITPTGAPSGLFGYSVSISGDGLYAVVGARDDGSGFANQGESFVFFRTGTSWALQAQLPEPTPSFSGSFGYSVSISGDGTYVAVGAAGHSYIGQAYIFVRTGTGWTAQATLTNPTGGGSNYGNSISISSDGLYAIVGAYTEEVPGPGVGRAYVYFRTGTSWALQATLINPTAENYSYFGHSVSISGDGLYAIVSANGEDVPGGDQGQSYIFARTGTSWALQSTLINPTGEAASWFGQSVSISGDGLYAIAGAYREDVTNTDQGQAYIFRQ